MRVLQFILKTLLVFVVVSVFFGLFGSFLLLTIGTQNFQNDLAYFSLLPLEKEKYITICRQAPASSQYSQPAAFQIRFISSTQYNLEVVCTLISDTPQVIKSATLPPFVTHAPGESGAYLTLDTDTSKQDLVITLQSFAKEKQFRFHEGEWSGESVKSRDPLAVPIAASLPQTSCEGRGFACCHPYAEKGDSTQATIGVTDCSDRCFSSCFPIPYVQAFNVEPFPTQNRTVEMTGQTLNAIFTYTAVSTGYPLKEVSIEYGDGQSETSTQNTGLFTHTYTCAGQCAYTVQLSVSDTSGQVSVVSQDSTFNIVRK